MGSLVQLGDVPAWIGAATGVASLYRGLRHRQQTQALDWATTLEDLAGLPPEALRRAVEDHPVVAQMADLAWEEAARTASEDKRRLLAKVVAAALRGDAAVEDLDELQFLLRTVMALDPAHVTLLVVLATPDPNREHQSWSNPPEYGIERDELTERWPAPDDLVDAALATLEREGLVAAESEYGAGKVRWWRLRPYGRRFFGFLERAGEAQSPSPPNP